MAPPGTSLSEEGIHASCDKSLMIYALGAMTCAGYIRTRAPVRLGIESDSLPMAALAQRICGAVPGLSLAVAAPIAAAARSVGAFERPDADLYFYHSKEDSYSPYEVALRVSRLKLEVAPYFLGYVQQRPSQEARFVTSIGAHLRRQSDEGLDHKAVLDLPHVSTVPAEAAIWTPVQWRMFTRDHSPDATVSIL